MEPEPDLAPATTTANPNLEREIIATAEAWARAWSAKEIDSYLSYYSEDFRPPQGLSRTTWEKQRRQRLTKPRYIKIKLLEPKVEPQGNNRALITFIQTYTSDNYSDRTKKSLQMMRSEIGWDIVKEDTLE